MAKKLAVEPIGEVEPLVIEDDDLELVFDDDFDDLGIEELTEEEMKPSLSPVKDVTDLSRIEALITDVNDSIEHLTWVIYGKNGTGKTTLLSTAEGVLILAAEDGTLSIRSKADNARKIRIDSWDKLEAVYWLLKDGKPTKKGIEIQTSTGKFVVKYVAIDTVTKLAEVCMRNIVLGEKEKDINKDVIKRTMRDWGDMSEKMKYWLQQFEELPVQRVWLFQENSNTDDLESEEFSIFPAINKSIRTYVLSEADIIARTYIAKTDKGVQYRLNASPNQSYVSKDRTNAINKGAINNPSLDKMYDVVFK